MTDGRRRLWLQHGLAGLLQAGLAGCASTPEVADTPAGAAPGADPLLSPWRTLIGGFLAPPSPGPGLPARPGTGMFVKLMAPTALALRGSELLVLDAGGNRLWRADTQFNTLTAVAGAPTGAGVALALGPDGSAWVMDPDSRRVLRFGRDGRLLQSFAVALATPTPVALALVDGGLTPLLADGMGAQWTEQRGPAAQAQRIAPADAGGRRISGVDGIAVRPGSGATPEALWVLDRLAGAVHRVQRDGRVLQTLGRGELRQPGALAVDRHDRVFVVDQGGRALVCLHSGAPAIHVTPAQLGVQLIGGLAIDDRLLALSDRLVGQVVMHRLGRPAAP